MSDDNPNMPKDGMNDEGMMGNEDMQKKEGMNDEKMGGDGMPAAGMNDEMTDDDNSNDE